MTRWLVSVTLLCSAAPAWADPTAEAAFQASVASMKSAVASLQDVTYTFYQTEYAGHKAQPQNVMAVRFRRTNDVFMEYKNNSQRVIWRGKSWNEGKLMADPGPYIPTLNLDPYGSIAMRGQRHAIDMVGFVAVSRLFAADAERILSDRAKWTTFDVKDEGTKTVFGEAAHCFYAKLPRDLEPKFYSNELRVCFNNRTKLPSQIQAYTVEDGQLRLVEDYGYEAIKVNVGLTDADFDPVALGF